MDENAGKISKKSGLPPGSLVYIGAAEAKTPELTAIKYNAESFKMWKGTVDECVQINNSEENLWLNLDGLQDTEIINKIGSKLNLHPLLLEDVVNTKHRPKFEEYPEYLFVTLKMLQISNKKDRIIHEQVSFVLGNNWLVSFQERQGDVFNTIRTRLSENKGIVRQRGVDYLMYSLIDAIVDNYFYISEHFNDKIEELEKEVLDDPSQSSLQKIQDLKRKLINFRKVIVPLREAVSSLQKYDIPLISSGTSRYLRDVSDHLIHLTDSTESQRDMLAGIMDMYLSGMSNKMNQVMKTLTIIATLFIPLTFIVGVYGMNFENMPELHYKYGYFIVWAVMIFISIMMLRYFKKKDWL